ncbi:MAG TPA: hypothetical protein VFT85_04735, partial [Acidimicrobiia bacterium]|nr:hypothetical protein [Acidimicrobiia bacterium]
MSNDLFKSLGIDIGKIVLDVMGAMLLPATLVKVTPGTPTAGNLAGGTNPTSTSYTCRGMVDSTRRENVDGGLEAAGILRVLLLANSISGGAVAPELGDHIIIEG